MTDLQNEKIKIPDTPVDAARELRKMLKWGEPFEDFIVFSLQVRIVLVFAILWLEEFDCKNQIEKTKGQE